MCVYCALDTIWLICNILRINNQTNAYGQWEKYSIHTRAIFYLRPTKNKKRRRKNCVDGCSIAIRRTKLVYNFHYVYCVFLCDINKQQTLTMERENKTKHDNFHKQFDYYCSIIFRINLNFLRKKKIKILSVLFFVCLHTLGLTESSYNAESANNNQKSQEYFH